MPVNKMQLQQANYFWELCVSVDLAPFTFCFLVILKKMSVMLTNLWVTDVYFVHKCGLNGQGKMPTSLFLQLYLLVEMFSLPQTKKLRDLRASCLDTAFTALRYCRFHCLWSVLVWRKPTLGLFYFGPTLPAHMSEGVSNNSIVLLHFL